MPAHHKALTEQPLNPKFFIQALWVCFFCFAFLLPPTKGAAESTTIDKICGVDRPILFGGLDWDSNAFHTEVARIILERGYGCDTDVLPGTSLPLLQGLARGDVDILMEVWQDNVTVAWTDSLERGLVVDLGVNFPDAVQGWYVPRYLIEGDAARNIEAAAPGLKSVRDLPKYKDLFRDPEQPEKGRFYNCIAGWACEVNNSDKLISYGLSESYTNFHPGTGAALAAAIASAYRRGAPLLTYYWGPTWVLGSYDLVKLEEPAYTPEAWQAFVANPRSAPAVAYPKSVVVVGANSEFAASAPGVIRFLTDYETTSKMVSDALSYMQANPGSTARDAAEYFIVQYPEVWHQWVSPAVAANVMQTRKEALSAFPITVGPALQQNINEAVAAFVSQFGDGFQTISDVMLSFILTVERGLAALPWWLLILIAMAVGYHATAHFVPPLLFGAALLGIGYLGLWELAVQTLALTFVSVFLCILIGLPLGIFLSRSELARRILMPILDAMQTLPSFVYLIPALMLFGLGMVPAVFATIIYATPPLIRLTSLGLQLVDVRYREAANDLGAERWRQLIDIELPLALPNLMAGLNQTIMMALSMVVIGSMIGARGLGEQVLLGIQRLDVGQGLLAGSAIVALAIVFDRVTQAYGRPDRVSPIPRGALRKLRERFTDR